MSTLSGEQVVAALGGAMMREQRRQLRKQLSIHSTDRMDIWRCWLEWGDLVTPNTRFERETLEQRTKLGERVLAELKAEHD
jgi:hypothetical protein